MNSISKEYRRSDRKRFGGNRIKVLERDNYCCQECGMTNDDHKNKWAREITIDHIDGNGRYSKIKNNSLDNLITLCLVCHGKKDVKRRGL
jgi:5-methylcytosine-specific restriction endonuclease McrA